MMMEPPLGVEPSLRPYEGHVPPAGGGVVRTERFELPTLWV
jgi:hypothetical protein